ncbi:MAG: hypothetical protein K9M57_01555 [Phycisphaerae bacterium]|nr:hypothetical protein [Phycisphaerae bacterium]
MKRNRNILIVLFLLAVPSVAQANVGTPLIWTGMFHLFVGNLIIGIVEGGILAKKFGLSKRKCTTLMILANYFSAWLGSLFIVNSISHALPMDLNNIWPLLWFMAAVTYLVTLVLEFPFVAFAFRGDKTWFRKSIRGSLLIQTISYGVLFGWYWLVSGTSLITKTDIVPLSSMSLPEKVMVYFISVDDGDLYAGSMQDTKWQNTFDLNSSNKNDRLLVKPSSYDPGSWDLIARLEADKFREPKIITVEEQFALITAPSWRGTNPDSPQYRGTWYNYGKVPKLGDAESSPWEFRSGFWGIEGLYGEESNSNKQVSFSLETPFISWPVRNAIHLPTDKILLQLGNDQICIYDPVKNQIALLTHGRGAIAVIKKEP